MLTDRQLDYLRCVAEGRTLRETASMMGATPAAVIDIARQARSALGARNAAHAVAIAYKTGVFHQLPSVVKQELELLRPLGGGWRMKALLDALIDAYPKSVSRDRLIEKMWPEPDDEPANPNASLHWTLHRLRERLPAHGWDIPQEKGRRGAYRLERTKGDTT